MKKIICVITLTILLSSCVTRRACERRFAGYPLDCDEAGLSTGTGVSSNNHTSNNTLTIIRDTTISVPIPGDTVQSSILLCDFSERNALTSSIPLKEISRLSTSLAVSSVWVSNGKINHQLEQRDTAIAATLKGALKTSATLEKREHTIVQTRYINQLSGWQWVQVYLGRVFLGVIGLVVSWYLLKRNLITV